jgi:hypothetical protein
MLDRPPRARDGGKRASNLRSGRRASAQRRYRQRQRDGRAVYRVEVDGEVVALLIRTRWLAEADAGDKQAVGRAISAMISDAAKR